MRVVRIAGVYTHNFKGWTGDRVIIMGGNSTIISGHNASGKSTIADAISWCLWGKDFQGRAKFNVLPLGPDGNTCETECSVTLELTVNGQQLILRRTYTENYTRKRGSVESVMSGHTTSYAIDDVPTSAQDYAKFVTATICGEDVWRVLTAPTAFHSLAVSDRRKVLLQSVPFDDSDILDRHPSLRQAMGCKGIDDCRKKWMSDAKAANQMLNQIPARIDEAQRRIRAESATEEELTAEYNALQARLSALTDEAANHKQHRDIEALRDELDTIRRQMSEVDDENSAYINEAFRAASVRHDAEMAAARKELNSIDINLIPTEFRRDRAREKLAQADADLADLRIRWRELDSQQWHGDTVCPTCGQSIPQERIRESMAAFAAQKEEQLSAINAAGQEQLTKRRAYDAELSAMQAEVDALKQAHDDASARFEAVRGNAPKLADMPFMPNYDDKMSVLEDWRRETEVRLSNLEENVPDISGERSEIQNAIDEIMRRLMAVRENHSIDTRIKELNEEKRKAGQALTTAEELLAELTAFITERMAAMEDNVNTRFDTVRWKLFANQVNGGIGDACSATVDGVPYEDLNNAAKITAGMEIINVVAESYGVRMPIIIDNAESVNVLPVCDAQTVAMYVTDSDYTVEVLNK